MMHLKLFIFLLSMLSLVPLVTIADDSTMESKNDTEFLSIFTKLPRDYYLFGQQLIKREELLPLSAVAGSTYAFYRYDQELWKSTSRTGKSPGYNHFWNSVEQFNGQYFQVSLVAGFLTWGLFGNERALRTSYQIARGILSSGIIVQVMKRATGRESPNKQSEPGGYWAGYPGEKQYGSDVARYDAMPSGHLQSAAVTFMVIAENYPEQKWIPWVGWPTMGVFAYSLAATNIHWWSDFPISLYLAYRFGKIVTHDNEKEEVVSNHKLKWDVYPTLSRTGDTMLTLNIEF